MRIALANLRFPTDREDSVSLVTTAVAEAGEAGAQVICFPEGFVPGYRLAAHPVAAPDATFLTSAWAGIASAAGSAGITVILGTERFVDGKLRLTAAVFSDKGTLVGFQDKVQLDPSEDDLYTPGTERHIFQAGPLTFGIVICHEGWRYPETVRWAARQGAQVVFHPHVHWPEPDGYVPVSFGDPANTFHEKAIFCRAAENTCYIASVNCAFPGSPTTSAVASPDGRLLAWQPYGQAGLLYADIDLTSATGLLAKRLRPTM